MECIINWIEHHPGTASWVQAVGSIAAVVAAFVVSHLQFRAQRNTTALRYKSRQFSYFAVAENLVDYSNQFADFSEHVGNYSTLKVNWDLMFRHSLESALKGMEAIAVHDLESREMVFAHSGLIATARSLLNGIDFCVTESSSNNKYWDIKVESSIRTQNINFYWKNYTDAFAKKWGVNPKTVHARKRLFEFDR